MKKATFILAAALASIAAIATAPANAGGKRLHFGGPLGSFEATPYAKGSGHGRSNYSKKRSSHAAKKAAARKHAAKKAAARNYAAQKAAKEAAARKYAAQKAAQQAAASKIAAKRAAQKEAAAAKHAAANRAAAQKIAAQRAAAAKTRRLAKADRNEVKSEPENQNDEDTAKLAPVKASAIAGTNTLEFEDKSNKADVAARADNDPETAAVEAEVGTDSRDETAELECKKYIPSAGMTISVPCGS
ncbi:MAG: hypothetical protein KJ622_12430 [Alphaproteobacteria bacterium]|nr:hypothetical protein [Alphaproteobacteria bacterium]